MSAQPEPLLSAQTAAPASIVIFGATGDLTKRKLMPALVRMLDCGLVHPDSRILGVVRDMDQDEWLQLVRDGLAEFSPAVSMDEARWQAFATRLRMVPGDLDDEGTYTRLADTLEELGGRRNAMCPAVR